MRSYVERFRRLLTRRVQWKRLLGLDYRPRVQVRRSFVRLGTEYGGYAVCPDGLGPGSVVYSFGIGEDISFDLELIARYGAEVFAFDPTPKSITWVRGQKLPLSFHFFEYGLADFDGRADFNPPENPEHVSHTVLPRPSTSDRSIRVKVYRLPTIMRMLGHDKVHVLKMDVEGAEYGVIGDMLRMGVDVGQLLVEFHGRFPGVGIGETRRAVRALNRAGYRIFDISGDVLCFIRA